MDLLVHLGEVFAIVDVEDRVPPWGPDKCVLFREMIEVIQMVLEGLGIQLPDPLLLNGMCHVELDKDEPLLS